MTGLENNGRATPQQVLHPLHQLPCDNPSRGCGMGASTTTTTTKWLVHDSISLPRLAASRGLQNNEVKMKRRVKALVMYLSLADHVFLCEDELSAAADADASGVVPLTPSLGTVAGVTFAAPFLLPGTTSSVFFLSSMVKFTPVLSELFCSGTWTDKVSLLLWEDLERAFLGSESTKITKCFVDTWFVAHLLKVGRTRHSLELGKFLSRVTFIFCQMPARLISWEKLGWTVQHCWWNLCAAHLYNQWNPQLFVLFFNFTVVCNGNMSTVYRVNYHPVSDNTHYKWAQRLTLELSLRTCTLAQLLSSNQNIIPWRLFLTCEQLWTNSHCMVTKLPRLAYVPVTKIGDW